MKNKKITGAVSALLSGTFYGVIPLVLLSVSSAGTAPSTLCNMYRQLFGVLMLLPFAVWRILRLRMPLRALAKVLAVGVFSGGQTLLLYLSFDLLPANTGIAITLHYLYPVFTLFLSVLFLHKKPSRRAVLGVLLAFTGVVVLCDLSLMPERPWAGVITAALSGFWCAMWLLLVEKLRLGETDKCVYTFSTMLGAALVLFVYHAVRHQLAAPFTAPQWGRLVLTGLLTLAAVTFLAQGIRYAGSVVAAVLSTMEPIVCTLGSALVLGDPVTGRMLLGAALVLGAVVFLTVMSGKETGPKAEN